MDAEERNDNARERPLLEQKKDWEQIFQKTVTGRIIHILKLHRDSRSKTVSIFRGNVFELSSSIPSFRRTELSLMHSTFPIFPISEYIINRSVQMFQAIR